MALFQRSPGETELRRSFEGRLPEMIRRAAKVRWPAMIPAHWFSAAASECAEMYVSGHFYGAISVAQAYVAALAGYLAEANSVRQATTLVLWERLQKEKVVSQSCADAACAVMDDRNDFHHMNKNIETEYRSLESRAETVIANVNFIEAEVFECSPSSEPGVIAPKNPRYWPSEKPGTTKVFLRQVW